MFPILPQLLSTLAATLPAPLPVFHQDAVPDEVWNLERLREVSATIQDQIAALRGHEFETPVKVQMADKESFLAYAQAKLEADGGKQRMLREEEVAKLLGLLPGDADLLAITTDVLLEQVGGFYDAHTDTFYVMDSVQPDMARIVIAHEFTHALDDQYYDLDGTEQALFGNADALMAYHAVVEGCGMELMIEWARLHMDGPARLRLARAQADLPSDAVSHAPPVIWKPLVSLYYQGQAFLRREKRASPFGEPARLGDLDRAFLEPPRSTEQVIHPLKYWSPDHRDEPRELLLVAGLPEGAAVRHENTLGELYAAMVTTPFEERGGLDVSVSGLLALSFTNDAASGWGGDRYALIAKGQGRLLVWSTRWDSVEDADEFAACLSDLSAEIEAAKASALGFDSSMSGLRLERVGSDGVRVTSWTGLSTDEATALGGDVRFDER